MFTIYDELFDEAGKDAKELAIIHQDLIFEISHADPLMDFYQLLDHEDQDLGLYLPDHIFDYLDPKPDESIIKFRKFVNKLRCTKQPKTKWGIELPNLEHHIGQRLGDFNDHAMLEADRLDYYAMRAEKSPEYQIKYDELDNKLDHQTAGDYLVNEFLEEINLGILEPQEALQKMNKEIEEYGVVLSKKQLMNLIELGMEVNNKLHKWCMRGWSSEELVKIFRRPAGRPSITLGDNLLKMADEGAIDLEDIKRAAKQMGIDLD